MKYRVEVWRDHKRCECYIGRKKDIPKFISHTIDDYDNGDCAYRIYRVFFGIYKRIGFRQKMKFLEQARK